jgi:hypothetical protein
MIFCLVNYFFGYFLIVVQLFSIVRQSSQRLLITYVSISMSGK